MDKLLDDGELRVVRFACDCYSAEHSLTVTVERDEDGRVSLCTFEPYLAGKPRLLWRIKQAIKCLKGKDGGLGDFVLREEDYPEMVSVISSLVKNAYTSGTQSGGI